MLTLYSENRFHLWRCCLKYFSKLIELVSKLLVILKFRRIRSRDFSVIASNCTGTLPYRFLNLPYNTPTISLFFYAPDYIRFVKRLDYYLEKPLRFSPTSRYPEGQQLLAERGHYPIGKLDDVEIHFLHYDSETEAVEKWNRRKARINRNNLVLVFTDKDLCTAELLAEFDALPYQKKIVLTANQYNNCNSAVRLPAFAGEAEVGDTYTRYDTLINADFKSLIDGPDDLLGQEIVEQPIS